MRLADPDDYPDARPVPRRSFEVTLKQALLRTYPVAPEVEELDDVFAQFLEKMAAFEKNKSGKA